MRVTFVSPFSLCSLILATGFVFAQQPAGKQPAAPTYDAGFFANNTYTNECMGISFTMPSGWLAKRQGFDGPSKAIHLPGGGLNLLMIEQPKQGTFGNTITLYAAPATEATGSAKDFVTHAVQTQVTRSPQNNELVRDTFPVDYAGKHFFRADYKTSKPRATLRSLIFTRFRDYYIGEMVEVGNTAELDSAIDSLKNISFREDVRDPKCATGQMARSRPMMGVIPLHSVVTTSLARNGP
jgi:hypothetical protein